MAGTKKKEDNDKFTHMFSYTFKNTGLEPKEYYTNYENAVKGYITWYKNQVKYNTIDQFTGHGITVLEED